MSDSSTSGDLAGRDANDSEQPQENSQVDQHGEVEASGAHASMNVPEPVLPVDDPGVEEHNPRPTDVDEDYAKRAERQAKLAELTQRYAARLEYYVRLDPYNWFNFYGFWDSPAGAAAGRANA